MREEEKIYRSIENRMIWGVAGGVAKYFKIDTTIVRLGFILLTLGGGAGVVIYVMLALMIPNETKELRVERKRSGNWLGLALILIGLGLLAERLFPNWWRWEIIWPVGLIVWGSYLVVSRK